MNNTKKLLVGILIFFIQTSYGQTYNYPKCNSQVDKDLKIVKIIRGEYSTTINFEYTRSEERGIYILLNKPNTNGAYFIRIGSKIYKLKSTSNIGNENGITSASQNIPVYFSATFETIPKTTKQFDLIEGETGTWHFYGIDLERKNESIRLCNYRNEENFEKPTDIKFVNNGEDFAIIYRICKSIKLKFNFTLIQVKNFKNAAAFIDSKGNRIIAYDNNFIKEIVSKSNEYSKIGILAHEIGHHFYNHVINNTKDIYELQKMEIEADYFAGYLLSKYEASESESTKFIEQLKDVNSVMSTHPAKSLRIEAVKAGYNLKATIKNEESNDEIYCNEMLQNLNGTKNPYERIAICDNMIKNNCNHKMNSIFNKANSYLEINQLDKALITINEYDDYEGFEYDLVLTLKGNILLKMEKFEEAEFVYQQISPFTNKIHTVFNYNYAICLQRLGKIEEAKKQYEGCIASGDNRANVVGNLSILYRDDFKNPEKAIKILEEFISKNGDDANIYNVLSVTYSKYKSNYERGLYFSNKAYTMKPNNYDFLLNRALNYYFLKKYNLAYLDLKICCESDNNLFACSMVKNLIEKKLVSN